MYVVGLSVWIYAHGLIFKWWYFYYLKGGFFVAVENKIISKVRFFHTRTNTYKTCGCYTITNTYKTCGCYTRTNHNLQLLALLPNLSEEDLITQFGRLWCRVAWGHGTCSFGGKCWVIELPSPLSYFHNLSLYF